VNVLGALPAFGGALVKIASPPAFAKLTSRSSFVVVTGAARGGRPLFFLRRGSGGYIPFEDSITE